MPELNSRGHQAGCNCPECSTLKGAIKNAPPMPGWRKNLIMVWFVGIIALVFLFLAMIGIV